MQLKALVINKLDMIKKPSIKYPILLPAPKEITEFNGNRGLVFNSQGSIQFLNVINPDFYANNLNESLKLFTEIKLSLEEPDNFMETILNETLIDNLLDIKNEEGYNLEIEKNFILIYSVHERGLFYGLQTLIQLLKNGRLKRRRFKEILLKRCLRLYHKFPQFHLAVFL